LRAGDYNVREVVANAGALLGTAIAAMVATVNINHVLLVGPAVALGDEWLDAIRGRATDSTLPLLASGMRIELGAGHDDVVMLGASALLMTHELGLSLAR
jgi:predicted NBD/HSP70 family sugar kinase